MKLIWVGRAKKTPKIKNFGLTVCPWDHEATHPWDLEATRDSYTTPQEAKEDFAPQAPPPLLPGVWYSSFPIIATCLQVCADCLQVRAGRLEVSSRVASRSQGTKFETKVFNFRCFLALPTETSFTAPHYYPKYEVWAIEVFVVVGSLSYQFLVFRMKKAL